MVASSRLVQHDERLIIQNCLEPRRLQKKAPFRPFPSPTSPQRTQTTSTHAHTLLLTRPPIAQPSMPTMRFTIALFAAAAVVAAQPGHEGYARLKQFAESVSAYAFHPCYATPAYDLTCLCKEGLLPEEVQCRRCLWNDVLHSGRLQERLSPWSCSLQSSSTQGT